MEESRLESSVSSNNPVAAEMAMRELNEGTAPDKMAPKGYLPFVEARKFSKSLRLKTRKEWRTYVKGEMTNMPPKPGNIPAHPDGIYKVKGWQGWKFWLGTADVGLSQPN